MADVSGVKKALITGITGQDGSYLAEFLLEKGYEIHGMVRRSSMFNRLRIEHLLNDPKLKGRMILHYGDMCDSNSIFRVVNSAKPDEIYNLAAQSHVGISFSSPDYTAQSDGLGAMRLLDTVYELGLVNKTKFYQASTSELYGNSQEIPQNENTPFKPVSPYGAAKLYAHYMVHSYRLSYGLFACNGILFNHESPRRGENFVSRKITISISKILAGKLDKLSLGNLNAQRDWGFAGDYVKAMWKMLQQEKPTDYVIATGKSHSVRRFVEMAFAYCDKEIVWEGDGVNEKGIDRKTGKILVDINPVYFRPKDIDILKGDASRAESEIGWKTDVDLDQLVEIMMKADIKNFYKQ